MEAVIVGVMVTGLAKLLLQEAMVSVVKAVVVICSTTVSVITIVDVIGGGGNGDVLCTNVP